MYCSLINSGYYTANKAQIDALVTGVGNFQPIEIGASIILITCADVRGMNGISIYEVPERKYKGINGAVSTEDDTTYRNRAANNFNSALIRVKSGPLDAIYMEEEDLIHIFNRLAEWPAAPQL